MNLNYSSHLALDECKNATAATSTATTKHCKNDYKDNVNLNKCPEMTTFLIVKKNSLKII